MQAKWFLAAALGALSISMPAGAVDPPADPVVYWNQVATQNIVGNPVLTSRSFAMIEVAIYDALNASTGGLNPSYTGMAATSGDSRAAVSTAARDTLLSVLPPNGTPARDTQRANIEASYQQSLALVAPGAARDAGIANGALAAANIFTARTGDHSTDVSTYAPQNPPVDGRYQLTGAGSPVTPQWGGVTPWTLDSGSQFRPAPPPGIDTPEFAAALAQVQEIGALNSATRTPEQRAAALFWASGAGTGLSPWINAGIAAADGRGFSSMQYAAMLALMTTNVADTTIGIFDAKYFYDYWRPVTAIHDLDPLSTWSSLVPAPLHPSYVSGHSAVGTSAADSLMVFLGDADACFAGYQCFADFGLAAQNGADSRLWGGIHYNFDNVAGVQLGHNVARFGIAAAQFTAVPEPATWLTMLIGFGLSGWQLRSRRNARETAVKNAV